MTTPGVRPEPGTGLAVVVRTEAEASLAKGAGARPIAAQDLSCAGTLHWRALGADAPASEPADRGPTIVLDAGAGAIFERRSIVELARLSEALSRDGLAFGFAGAIERADVPRLLVLRPSCLILDGTVRDPSGALDAALVRSFAALVAPPDARLPHPNPDRVFVRDLVEEIEIGAYRSEAGRRQRVRFDVHADIAPADPGQGLRNIYSYDLIMDAVRLLCARPPEPFVETLAEHLAAAILADRRVQAVTIHVEKLDLGPGAAGIEIRRTRT